MYVSYIQLINNAIEFKKKKKERNQRPPWWLVVKNLPANAKDRGSILGLGRTPRAMEQLGPRATTIEPVF